MRAAQPRRGRLRAALLVGAVLTLGLPVVASAIAPRLTCGVALHGRWETLPVPAFRLVNGLAGSTKQSIAAYSVDRGRPQDVAVTNGYRIQLSRSNGCAWADSFALSPTPTTGQPFPGLTSTINQVALLSGRVLATVQEGSGAASRPHVLVSLNGSSWTTSDNGLPVQGAPRLLRAAADGRTAYLTISPTATGGDPGGGILPGLPDGGLGTTPTGLLYRTADGGTSWTLQTGAADLPGGGTGFSQLDLDAGSTNTLYGTVDGRLVTSDDGGASFTSGPTGITAVTALGPGSLAAFRADGTGYLSTNSGQSYSTFRAPTGITSAAFRRDSTYLVVESSGVLRTFEPGGTVTSIPAGSPATRGTLLGDRGAQSGFHALSGRALLRYVDPLVKGATLPPLAAGDLSVTPPNVGAVLPGVRTVRLPVGTSEREPFVLDLPKNPTPLDLFFLIDVSTGMEPVISDIKANVNKIIASLTAAHVNLKVGVGTLGTSPARGEAAFPDAYLYPPDPSTLKPDSRRYVKPSAYHLIRGIGDIDGALTTAVNRLQIETQPGQTGNHEGQLIALKNLAEGQGQATEQEDRYHLPSRTEVAPGQQAGFRPNPGVRRVVVLATNEAFDAPYGTDQLPGSDPHSGNPRLDFAPTLRVLNRNHIQVLGLTAGESVAEDDLRTVVGGTHLTTPPGGIACDGDQVLAPGEPIVCNNASLFSNVIIRVLASLVDRQDVLVVPANRSPVLGALDGRALLGLDVKKPNEAAFSVNVSCVGVAPGTYAQDVNAVLRQTVVGRARLNVTCVRAAAIAPPKPIALGNPPPPPAAQPVGNIAPPVAPPAPAAQPQVNPQVNVQTQIQPMTSGAIQEQQELQLALALNGTLKDDDPVFNPGAQLAMVDRRKREEVQALGVLAFAIVACGGLGLAKLRARPEIAVRRA